MKRFLRFSLFSILYLVFLTKADLYCAVSTESTVIETKEVACGSSCCEDAAEKSCSAPCCQVSHSHSPQSLTSSSQAQFSADKKIKGISTILPSNVFCGESLAVEPSKILLPPYKESKLRTSLLVLYCIWRC